MSELQLGRIEQLTTTNKIADFDMAASTALLQQVVKDATNNLPKVYGVFEYNPENGSFSRTPEPMIVNLMTSKPWDAVKIVKDVSIRNNKIFAIIGLRAIQTAPNTVVYDGTDDVYTVIIQGIVYRKGDQ